MVPLNYAKFALFYCVGFLIKIVFFPILSLLFLHFVFVDLSILICSNSSWQRALAHWGISAMKMIWLNYLKAVVAVSNIESSKPTLLTTSNIVFVSQTNGPQGVSSHWFNHSLDHRLLILFRESLHFAINPKNVFATVEL